MGRDRPSNVLSHDVSEADVLEAECRAGGGSQSPLHRPEAGVRGRPPTGSLPTTNHRDGVRRMFAPATAMLHASRSTRDSLSQWARGSLFDGLKLDVLGDDGTDVKRRRDFSCKPGLWLRFCVLIVLGCTVMLWRFAPGRVIETEPHSGPVRWAVHKKDDDVQRAIAVVQPHAIQPHIRFLSTSPFDSRTIGSVGEQTVASYVATELELMGYGPSGTNDTFFQRVPVVTLRADPKSYVRFSTLSTEDVFSASGDAVLWTEKVPTQGKEGEEVVVEEEEEEEEDVDASLVFVGFGIRSVEEHWDDYGTLDMVGKVLVSLAGEPPPTPTSPRRFQSDAVSPYAHWSHKVDEARRRGAKGLILLDSSHQTGFSFDEVNRWSNHIVLNPGSTEGALEIVGWLAEGPSNRVAQLCGASLTQWFHEASSTSFLPISLDAHVFAHLKFSVHRFYGTNVIARLGPPPDEGASCILYTSHYGYSYETQNKRPLSSGSVLGMLLATARAFSIMGHQPCVYMALLTGREVGHHVGIRHFLASPVLPLQRICGAIHFECGNVWGRTEDVVGLGMEQNSLGKAFQQAMKEEKLAVSSDPAPELGSFVRSDAFALVLHGIPSIPIHTHCYQEDPSWPLDPRDGDAMEGVVQQTRVAVRMGLFLVTQR